MSDSFPFKPLHVWTIPTRGAGFGSNCQLSQAGNRALRCWIWIWIWEISAELIHQFSMTASPPCFSMQCYVSVLILETRSSFERAVCTSELWQTRLDLLEDMKVLKTGQNIAVPHCSESRPWVLEPLWPRISFAHATEASWMLLWFGDCWSSSLCAASPQEHWWQMQGIAS